MAMMAATISPAVVCSTASLTVVRSRAARSPSSFFGASTAGSFRHSSVQAIPVVSFAPRQTDSRRGSSRVVCGLFGLGLPELLVVGGVALVLFGPKQLPEVGKGLGRTVKGFQEAAKEFQSELKNAAEGGESEQPAGTDKAAAPPSTPAAPPAPTAVPPTTPPADKQ
eukprot:TRINITY_DN4473_c0_g1_i4.p1 TRINITY_DN4473_c0_g1~~TRINITY_DN4473_c0_g1_i4.p1  ORF type:complete len:167 (-),score=27.94 TRINITY_DN4473_c0_g1_i4:213-713(-)